MTSTPSSSPGLSLQVTIFIDPENVPKFFEAFLPAYEKVTAEPECTFFEVYQSLENPGELSWVENWQKKTASCSVAGQYAFNLSRSVHTSCNANPDWFHYTRGRFVTNEAHEMLIRHVEFDMSELAKCAAESVGFPHTECTQIEKFPDGMYNKAFLFTMQDGIQVVGKVPNPNAGRAHYTTASEVATMDFARNELQTPVPRVLAWSSRAEETPVRAEYIIMEKVPGVQLEKVWPKMDIKQRFELVKTISKYQKAWMSTTFSQYGSLYYSDDINGAEGCGLIKQDSSLSSHQRFAVGPSTGREFVDDGRLSLDFHRGPWNTVEEYKSAIGLREIACVQQINQLPRSPLSLYGPATYVPPRSKKIAALQNYLRLVKYLLPTDNIFVDAERPSEVLGIIDWQSSEILPELSPVEKARAQDLYLKMSLSALYRKLTLKTNSALFKAMEFRQTIGFDIMLYAQNILIDGEALYQSSCLDLANGWADLPAVEGGESPPFPLRFSSEEIQIINEDAEAAVKAMELMGELRDEVGDLWPEKGIVRPEQYNEAKQRLKQAKEELIGRLANTCAERVAWEEAWPFDNGTR
ncbi:hypothetical protein BJX64DRAFT_297366 [Aspergillus heterothallicus]